MKNLLAGEITEPWRNLASMNRLFYGTFDVRLLALVFAVAYLLSTLPLLSAAVALAGITGLVTVLRQPWMLWVFIGAILPFASAQPIGPATLADLLVFGAIGLWFIDGVRQHSLRLRLSAPVALVGVFIVYQLGLLLIAVDLGEAGTEVIKWVEIVAILALIPSMVSSRNRTWVVSGLLCGGVLQALLGLYQFVFQVGHPSFVLMDRFMRASGTFGQPNPYAGYLGTLLPVAISLVIYGLMQLRLNGEAHGATARIVWDANLPARRRGNLLDFGLASQRLLLYVCAAGLIGLGIIVSWSRGGWLGTAAAVAFVLFFRSRRALFIGTGCAFVIASVLLLSSLDASIVPASLQARLGNLSGYLGVNMEQILDQPVDDDNFAILERLAHWKAAIWMWQQSPWLGVGPGGYATVYPTAIQTDARLLRWEDPLGHAHNIYLNLLAETGLVGLIIYGGVMLSLFGWVGLRTRRCTRGTPFQQALAVGTMGVLVYLFVHNGFDNVYVQGIYLHLGFWLGLLVDPGNKPSLYLGNKVQV